jgi:malate permease and related proteins
MGNVFLITIEQLLIMLVFMVIGFSLRKSGILLEPTGKILSVLEVYVFVPAFLISNLSANLNMDVIIGKLNYLLIGAALLIAMLGLAYVLSHVLTKDSNLRNILMYAFAFANYGYIGYPLIDAVYGGTVLSNFIIFAIPFTIFIQLIGRYLLGDEKIKLWRKLLTPSLIAIILGILGGVFGFRYPEILSITLTKASACMSPIAMLLTGFVLAGRRFVELVNSPKVYLFALIRLIAIPVSVGLCLLAFGVGTEWIMMAVMITAMPVGVNTIIFPEAYGGESAAGARICFISNILSVLTIPVLLALIS